MQLREEIRRIQLELGITTLYVTHDQEEALSISDRVAVMWNGKIEQIGSPAEMYGSPATPFVAEFIGTMNRLTVHRRRRRRHRLRRACGSRSTPRRGCRAASACSASCARRPSTWPSPTVHPLEGGLTGDVVSKIFLGAVTRVRVEDGERSLVADLSTSRAAPLAVGTRVVASFAFVEPPAAGPHRGRIAARARSGQSVKMPSTPSAESSRMRSGSFTV